MTTVKTVQKTTFLHYTLKKVEDWNRNTPEKDVQVLAMSQSLTDVWEKNWKQYYGVLLHIEESVVTFSMPDPVKVEVEFCKQEISRIQAESEMAVKVYRDRINDLQMLGYDAGSVKVVDSGDVVDAEAKGVSDDCPF